MALTKQDVKEIGKMFETQKEYLDKRMDQSFNAQRQDFDTKMDQRFDAQKKHFDTKMDQSFDAQRQYVDHKIDQKVDLLRVLIEDVRSDIKLLAEGREPIIQKQDDHEKKIVQHEKRITTLEDFTYTQNRPK